MIKSVNKYTKTTISKFKLFGYKIYEKEVMVIKDGTITEPSKYVVELPLIECAECN